MTALKDEPLVKAALAAFPGAEIVDVRHAPSPTGLAAGTKPAAGYSLAELAKTAREECARILETQQNLVRTGARSGRDAGEVERSRKFEALARLAEKSAADPVIIAQLRKAAS